MSIHIHHLDGCAPQPLAHYLKALGILRLVSEQADPNARGWWQGNRFKLATTLDQAALKNFFLNEYQPTPIFNPWGGRSGFYPEGSEKKSREILNKIVKAPKDLKEPTGPSDKRFDEFRQAFGIIKKSIQEITKGKKPDKKAEKLVFIQNLKKNIRGAAELWLSSVVALMNDKFVFPALFGTGGNEGSVSYTAAFMLALERAIVDRKSDGFLDHCLWSANVSGELWDQSFGQFTLDGIKSPWDIILAFEGACLIHSSVVKTLASKSTSRLSSPFFLAPSGYGYASRSPKDEVFYKNGKPLPGRGEQWFPLWAQSSSLAEIKQLFSEGRASAKRKTASDALSMSRAISSLGTTRGLTSFVRFGYQQRNNLASHFAVPLGQVLIPSASVPILACLDDIDDWRFRLQRITSETKKPPARLKAVERQLMETLFAVVQHPNEPARWQAVLMALADVESVMVKGTGFEAGPVPQLRPDWVKAAYDGSPEFRLALAFALQSNPSIKPNQQPDCMRRHWLPLNKNRFATSSEGGRARLQASSDVVIMGRDGVSDAIAVLERRLIEGAMDSKRGLELFPARWAAAQISDIALLLSGAVDINRVMTLARALMAVDANVWKRKLQYLASPGNLEWPDNLWLLLRLALSPWPLENGLRIPHDPAVLRRLAAGDCAGAVEIAHRRLHASGLKPKIRAGVVDANTARLWAAALAFPLDERTMKDVVKRVVVTPKRGEQS